MFGSVANSKTSAASDPSMEDPALTVWANLSRFKTNDVFGECAILSIVVFYGCDCSEEGGKVYVGQSFIGIFEDFLWRRMLGF